MTDVTATEDFMEHYGVKGMKWGVRNDKGHEGERARIKTINKADREFANPNSIKLWISIHNRASELSNANDIPRINSKPEWVAASKRKEFLKDTPLTQRYLKEHTDAFLKNLDQAATERGTNASGTKKYGVKVSDPVTGNWHVTLDSVKHAGNTIDSFIVEVSRDANGLITSLKIPDFISHAVNDILEHFGVKGMKWGVRNSKKTTGVSRGKGALIDRNDRAKKVIKDARSGKDHRALAAIGRAFVGKEQQKINWSTMIKSLNAQNKRLKMDKATFNDKFKIAMTTSVVDLVVSRRPA